MRIRFAAIAHGLVSVALAASILSASCARQQSEVELGKAIVHGSLCVQCHGDLLQGATQGPPLKNLGRHWTEKELIRYLKNPAEFVKIDLRLQELGKQYNTLMPVFQMDEETRRSVARYLLEGQDN
jgi:mono/diheme cytochrome c family protein